MVVGCFARWELSFRVTERHHAGTSIVIYPCASIDIVNYYMTIIFGGSYDECPGWIPLRKFANSAMAKLEQMLLVPHTGESSQGNMPAAKLLGKRTHQMPGPDKGKPIIIITDSCNL